ncbi:MAG: ATP-grasp domain-containing protein [Nitrospira sp.]|nr:MAG: ATP-grasp domain-containing protein [Nitrospira sp.]
MFRKILIANRGEIAMRIIRGCRELNIATAAIYSEADSSGIYVKKADESYLVGPGPVKGFLDGKQIVEIAKRIGADAIHPGYGFLSENTKFARLCQTSGITFIGPSPETIDLMGSKVKARQIAQQAGVPIVPGTEGGVTSVDEALAFAHQINYPVMIKASAGGGGRGLRVVRSDQELRENIDVASREAQAAFGDGSIFIEKYIERPHHIEFQILGDKHGNIIHLGEPAAGDEACVWFAPIRNCGRTLTSRREKLRPRSATAASSSRNISSGRTISNFKSWATNTATSSTWASGIVPFSVGTRN